MSRKERGALPSLPGSNCTDGRYEESTWIRPLLVLNELFNEGLKYVTDQLG